MAATEAKPGEFSLVYNTPEGGRPVVLTLAQHAMLQALIRALGDINVVNNVSVRYLKE